MADLNELLAAAAGNSAAPTPTPSPMDATSARIQQSLSFLTPSKQDTVLEKMGNLTGQSYFPLAVAKSRNSNAGLDSASTVERDLRTMEPMAFTLKYGEDGQKMLDQYVSSQRDVMNQNSQTRDDGQIVGDTINSVVTGLGSTLGTLGAWGAGAIDPKIGAAVSKNIADAQAEMQSRKSDVTQSHAAQSDALYGLQKRDTQAQFEKEKAAGSSDLMATLRREGRNALNTIGNDLSDPTQFGEGAANAVGSLLATGPMAKVIGLGGKAISSLVPTSTKAAIATSAAIDAATGTTSAARLLAGAAEKTAAVAPGALAIGAMEGGGAYQQTAADVMNMSPEDLAKTSPEFNKMVAGGMTPEDARATLAGRAGMEAAKIQAPVGVLTGALVAPFEAHPFKFGSARTAVQNLGKEAVEEGVQNATGQMSQNYAEANQGVDPAKDLFDSVGQQFGQGALYGAAAAGHVAAPGVLLGTTGRAALGAANLTAQAGSSALDAVRTGLSKAKDFAQNAAPELTPNMPNIPNVGGVADAVKGAVDAAKPYVSRVTDYFANKGDAVMKANEKNSPVSDEVMSQAADEVSQQAAQTEALKQQVNETPDVPEEAKQSANDYLDQASKITQLTPEQVQDWHPAAQAAVSGATNRMSAIQSMASFVADAQHPEADRLAVAAQLEAEKADIGRFVDSNPRQLDGLPADHSIREFADNVATFAKGIEQTPSMARADRAAKDLIEKAGEIIKPITEESINTPEGVANAKTVANLAQVAPQQLDPKSLGVVLKHASKIGLTETQKAAIRAAAGLLNTAKAHFDELEANGDKPLSAKDLVTKDVTTGEPGGPVKKSALGHAQIIGAAYRAGDLERARSQLLDLQKFAQSQRNKLGAVNQALVGGHSNPQNAVSYDTLSGNADRSFHPAKKGVYVDPTYASNVRLARRVASEAKFLTDLANHLATAFPELKVEHLEPSVLDPRLAEGTVDDVVAGFKDGTRSVKAKSDTAETKSQEQKQPVTTEESASAVPAQKDTVKDATPVSKAEKVAEPEAKVENVVPDTKETSKEDSKVEAQVTDSKAETPEPEKKGVAAVFPDLIAPKSGGNMFTSSFSLARGVDENTPASNVLVHEKPIQGVADAVIEAINKLPSKVSDDVYDAYHDLFKQAVGLTKGLRKQLATFLSEKNVEKRFRAEDGKAAYAHRWLDGKLLNLTEDRNGTFQYNDQLLHGAALAAISWFTNAGQLGGVYDQTDAAKLLGIPFNAVDDTLQARLKGSIGTLEAMDSLASKIQQYWGVRGNDKAPIGYTEGIPLSMAGELLRAMEAQGLITTDTFWVDTSENGGLITDPELQVEGDNIKSILRIVPVQLDKEAPMRKYPDLIDQAVLPEHEPTYYLNDQKPNAKREQMRNEYVKNTEEQIRALKNENSTPYYLNQTMANLYLDMDEALAIKWFGAGDLEGRALNVNHKATLEGQNMTIRAAYKEFVNMHDAIQAKAEELGIEPDQVVQRFGNNFSRVARIQQLGKYTPQSTKFIREVMLPNRATLDLTDAGHMRAFELGLGQALGVKVHNLQMEATQAKLYGLLDGKLKPAVEHFQSWLKGEASLNENVIEGAFKDAGMDISPLALHALTEYARFQNADEKARQAFTTTKYLEADGMTNGPINAMALLSTGPFTADWVTNMRRGGLEIGGTKEDTSQKIRSGPDAADLYQVTTDRLKGHLRDLKQTLSGQKDPAAHKQMLNLVRLMDMFTPDLEITPKGLEIGRGIAKNPLTITIYGSGANGIAAKMVKTLTTALYERATEAAQRMKDNKDLSPAEAFFPNDPNAAERFSAFSEIMTDLTQSYVGYNKDQRRYYVQKAPTQENKTLGDFEKFTLRPDELKNMSSNMRTLFVDPLRLAIKDTVGDLEKSTNLIRQATQVQSILMGHIFVDNVNKALDEKAAKNPETFKRDEFLSRSELNKVMDELAKYHPLIQQGDQAFFVAGSQNSEVNTADFGRALDGKFRYPGMVYGPANSGVAGIPFLNIGMGDGKMMQLLANDPRVQRTLKIFDGMNMPLDRIMEQSEAANEAVLKSWQGNPMQAVFDAYSPFLAQLDKDGITNLPNDVMDQLARSFFGPEADHTTTSLDEILGQMHVLEAQVKEAALQIEARHNVMDKINLSVDQMSSAGSPHVVEGKTLITGTDEEKAMILSAMYAEELAKLKKQEPVNAEPEKENTAAVEAKGIADQINQFGRINKQSRARVLSPTAIKKLVAKSDVPAFQKTVLDEIRRSLAAKGYEIVTGTREQLVNHALMKGDSNATFGPEVGGVTLPAAQRIYLVNPTSEILTHELIHASTFETLLAHYAGEGLQGPVADAIGNIESLMDQFLSLDVSQEDLNTQRAWSNAVGAIRSVIDQTPEGRASALNEFMAWALANKDLADLGKKTVSLVQMAKDVFESIKQMVFGRKLVPAPKPGQDLFSNLLFNTAVVMRTQPSIMEVARPTALFHSTAYGTSERLMDTNRNFFNMLERFKNQPENPNSPSTPKADVGSAAAQAAGLAIRVQGQGFPMSMQEATTFSLITAALGTQMHIDPNSMALAQELYQHVAKHLEVEMFMKDPNSDTDPNDRYQAQRKYNAILGEFGSTKDKHGRSSLLPTFLGLATVSDDFRAVLNKIGLPEKMKSTAESRLDATLENLGQGLMDKMADSLSGASREKNVQAAVDGLMDHIMQVAQEREMFMNQTQAGTVIDTVNQAIVDGVEHLTDKVIDRMQQVIDNPKSSAWAKNAAKYAQLSAQMATEKGGNIVAESVVSHMNRINAWQPLHDMVYDFVGRTEQNAPVYDMMKLVRAQVSQDRQNYREHVPGVIADKFSRTLEDHEWTTLHRALAKTDVAALRDTLKNEEIHELLGDAKQLDSAINALEGQIQSMDPKNWSQYQKKAQQLARFMMTGEVGQNLLRNATAVANLFNEKKRPGTKPSPELVKAIDQLVSMYALEHLSPTEKATLSSLVQKEADGIGFATDYLVGQRAEEERKLSKSARARMNGFKGFVPEVTKAGVHLIVADDSQYQKLTEESYERVADYQGSTADGTKKRMGYYFSPTSAKTLFNQGIFQNVRQTAGGVDIVSGYNNSTLTAGRITDRGEVARILLNQSLGEKGKEPLMPIFDANGQVIAFERSIDPEQMARIQTDQNLAQRIGAWRGRQVEEAKAQEFNNTLIDALHDRYERDMKASQSKEAEYVNLFDKAFLKSDPVIADAVKLWTPETVARIKAVFGDDGFFVPKDMLHDVTGYRQASVGDVFTGNSRWSPATQEYVKRTMIGMFGNKAYQYFTNGERTLQNFIGDAKTLIVVKSVVVPITNMLGNLFQLMSRGVPIKHIAVGAPKKIAETNFYVKQRQMQIEIEANLRAATEDPTETRRLTTQWNSIEDSLKRLSIYPLIQAGEFTAISDATQVGSDDVELTSGKWHSFMEAQVAKLPKSLQTAGRYALVTKDTALFKGLQKSVEYGDFIAKAVFYDDLLRKGMTKEQALGKVTEEFVNYDKLPGRFRGYLESVGLLWFYNFKIRATKTALSMVRNNPLHTLLAAAVPIPDVFGSVGTPFDDNFISKLFSGQLGYSWGLGQVLHAPQMNPWVNILG